MRIRLSFVIGLVALAGMASAAACSSFGDTSEPLPDEAGDAATVPEGAAPAESGADADADAAVDGSVAFPCKAGQTAFCQDFDTAPRPWAFTFVGEQGDAGGSDASVASVTTTTADLPPSAPNALHAHLAPGGDQAVLTLALPAQGNVMRVQFDVRVKTPEATSIGLGGIGFGVARLVALGTENGKLKVYTADGTAGMSASLAVADLGDAWARIVLEYSIRDGFYDLYVDDKHVVTHAVGPTYLATDPSIFCSIGATSKATPSTVDVLFDNYAVVWK